MELAERVKWSFRKEAESGRLCGAEWDRARGVALPRLLRASSAQVRHTKGRMSGHNQRSRPWLGGTWSLNKVRRTTYVGRKEA